MTSLLLAVLALAPLATSPSQDSDALVVYSAGLDRVLSDPHDAGLARALRLVEPRLVELGQELGGPVDPEAVAFVSDLLHGRWCLRVGSGGMAPRVQLTVACDADAAEQLASRARRLLEDAGAPVEPGQDERVWQTFTPVGPLGCDRVQDGLRFCVGEPRPEPFEFETGLPAGSEPLLFARYDGARAGELMQGLMLGSGAEVGWPALEALGLVGEAAPSRTWAMGEHAGRLRVVSREEGHARWLEQHGYRPDEMLAAEDLGRVPADVTAVTLFPVHAERLVPLLDRIEAGFGQQATEALRGFAEVDLQEDLLAQLGPTGGVYASRTTGGGGLMSLVGFVEVRDAERVARALSRLTTAARKALKDPTGGRVAFEAWTLEETPCSTLVFRGLPVPLELSYALADDALYVALTPTALRVALGQRGRSTSVLDHARIGDVTMEDLGDAVGFAFVDAPYYVERGYGLASLVCAGLSNAVRSPEHPRRSAGQVLPTLPVLAQGVRPWTSLARVVDGDRVCTLTCDRSFLADMTVLAGTPLAHSYAGVIALSTVSAVAIPNLMAARSSANENAAIATLRAVAAAQQQFQHSVAIDQDADGAGEYGTFGDLSGARPMRVAVVGDPEGVHGGWGNDDEDVLDPPFLTPTFAQLEDDGTGEAVVRRQGYVFKIFLPTDLGGTHAVGEPMERGPRPPMHPGGSEMFWCCYAWPEVPEKTGNRVFFMSQSGEVLVFENRESVYGGTVATGGTQPSFDAAIPDPGNLMDASLDTGGVGQDGNTWTPVR